MAEERATQGRMARTKPEKKGNETSLERRLELDFVPLCFGVQGIVFEALDALLFMHLLSRKECAPFHWSIQAPDSTGNEPQAKARTKAWAEGWAGLGWPELAGLG